MTIARILHTTDADTDTRSHPRKVGGAKVGGEKVGKQMFGSKGAETMYRSQPITGFPMTGSVRLMILVTFAAAMAIASFAHTFAMMLGVAAISFAGGIALIVVLGAVVSLGRNRNDETLPASVRLSNEDIG